MPQPLAIGLINAGSSVDRVTRRRSRTLIDRFAEREGYALLETFEVVGDVVQDSSTLTVLEHLAARVGVGTLLVDYDITCFESPRLLDVSMTLIVVSRPVGPHASQSAGS